MRLRRLPENPEGQISPRSRSAEGISRTADDKEDVDTPVGGLTSTRLLITMPIFLVTYIQNTELPKEAVVATLATFMQGMDMATVKASGFCSALA